MTKEGKTKLVVHNGDGTSEIRSWFLILIPVMAVFLTFFGNYVLIKSKIPDLQKQQEAIERKYESVNTDLQNTKQTMTGAIAGFTATLQGIDDRLKRIESNTKRDRIER